MSVLVPLARRPQIPAWIVSTVVHAILMLLLVLWVGTARQGASEAPLRDVGIVLKRTTPAGVQFDGEADTLANQTAEVDSPNPNPSETSPALPDSQALSTASESLPVLPSLGPTAGGDAGENAAAMTQGGGTTGGARGDVGEKTSTSVFGVEGTGTRFVYVFDRSASMDGDPMRAAKRELLASLESLDEICQFHIIFFNSSAPLHARLNVGARNRIATADQQNKLLARRFVESVTAYGGTVRETALIEALQLGPDVIFFLTDADDEMSAAELRNIYRLSERHGTSINVIEFGRGPDPRRDHFLRQLARNCGGQYGYINTSTLTGGAP